MESLVKLCVRRPIFSAVLALTIVVVGIAGFSQLGLDQFPKIDSPSVTITTRMAGASPEEIETDVTQKVEEAVSSISGLDSLESTSSDGVSSVRAQFVLEKSGDVAAQEVRDHVDRVLSELPDAAKKPEIQKMDPDAQAILHVALRTQRPIGEATEVADKKVKRLLQSVSGVGSVNVVGGRARQISVWVDPVALSARGLTAADVKGAIASGNTSIPGGTVQAGPTDSTLRVRGQVEEPAALGAIVVKQANGAPIRVRDVARIEDGYEEQTSVATVNGERTLLLTIRKQSGANTLEVVDEVRDRLGTIEKTLPEGYRLEVVRDGSGVVRTSVSTVEEHLVLGAILASLVVLLFLGSARSAAVAALAIPVSIVGTFALMWWQGFTLNMITLLALALAVGIVIDDAIVVLENIHRFVEEKGMKPFPAAIAATKDIGLAVLATTLSLMAVFLPVAFMSGMAGRFMRGFGVTMACAIGVSMLVSFTLTPALAARVVEPPADGATGGQRKKIRLERLVDRLYGPIERGYLALLRWVMARRWVVVVASVVTLASSVPLAAVVPKALLPENDEAQFQVSVRAPEGTSVESTLLVAERIAREVRASIPGVRVTSTTIGDNDGAANLARIYVGLTDPAERKESAVLLMERVRKEIVPHQAKELRVEVSEVSGVGGGNPNAISYTITGPDLKELARYAKTIVAELKKVQGAADVTSSYIDGKPELDAVLDRDRAADLGVSTGDVASTLLLTVGGQTVSTYSEGGEDYDVKLRAERAYRADAEGLGLITVPSTLRGPVPVRDVVQVRQTTGPSSIERESRQRRITITANAAPGYSQSDVSAPLGRIVDGLHLPAGYRAQPSGMTRETGKTISAFVGAFLLSFVFMYLVLAAQFESWLHPITILLSLPLTIPFALISLFLLNGSLNMFTGLGLFVLFGIVKKNSILQVDHANSLRREGMPRAEAVLRSNRDRLRPILMTTLAFVAGMVPLAFSKGIGAGQSRAIASVIIGGQSLSLLLTLVATPVFYTLFDDAAEWLHARLRRTDAADRGEA